MSNDEYAVMEFALSFPVNVRSLPPKGLDLALKTDEQECKKLAQNHNLLAVDNLNAEFHLGSWKKRGIRVQGVISAAVVQECVVTGEPVENKIHETVDVIFVPEDSNLAKPGNDDSYEIFLDAEGPDAPEVFSGNHIDIGAVAEEFFELALDPYPRKADAQFDEIVIGEQASDTAAKISPFAALKQLKEP